MHNAVTGIIDSKNDCTLGEIKQELDHLRIVASKSTISRAIKKMRYSRKVLSLIPVERNTPNAIERRIGYARHVSNLSDDQMLFLDECGFNFHTSRHFGYSTVNQKAVKNITGNRGQNTSLLSVISNSGCEASRIFRGAVNTQRLVDFIQEELREFPTNEPKKTLILDNVRFHHSPEVKEACIRKNLNILFLPPYSPQLNPIEEFFGIIKSFYKRSTAPKTTFEEMSRKINAAIFQVEFQNFRNLFRKMREWVDIALNGRPFI